MEIVRVHLIISGSVQGVFFRQNTYNLAISKNLKGYVRNLSDGSVEAVFEGDPKDVDDMIKWCYIGPESARVDNVRVFREQSLEEFSSFDIFYF